MPTTVSASWRGGNVKFSTEFYIYFQNIQIRLTVAEVGSSEQGTNSKPCSIGHVIVGPASTGRSFSHWRQMLAALRRPVAMWHPLRK